MEKDRAKFENVGAKVIAIAVQDEAGAAKSVEASKAGFPILADAEHLVTELYGVLGLIEDPNLATPAVFVIDQNGLIRWSYVAKYESDRPSNQTILENLPG